MSVSTIGARLAHDSIVVRRFNGRAAARVVPSLDDHIGNLGDHFEKAMKFHNNAVGAFESRVLVFARRFRVLGVGRSVAEIPVLEPLDMPLRGLRSPELTDGVVEA